MRLRCKKCKPPSATLPPPAAGGSKSEGPYVQGAQGLSAKEKRGGREEGGRKGRGGRGRREEKGEGGEGGRGEWGRRGRKGKRERE